jgi:hypothetical protein
VLSRADFLSGADEDEPGNVLQVEIWSCNEVAVEVFEGCRIDAVSGMSGAFWIGVASSEIESALRLRQIPESEWPDLVEDVQCMSQAVCDHRNREAQDAAERQRTRR